MSIKDNVLATYLGGGDPALRFSDYYPEWLDKLADDVTLEGSLMDGAVQGREAVRVILGAGHPNRRELPSGAKSQTAAEYESAHTCVAVSAVRDLAPYGTQRRMELSAVWNSAPYGTKYLRPTKPPVLDEAPLGVQGPIEGD